jgi:flagellar protein FlgJ
MSVGDVSASALKAATTRADNDRLRAATRDFEAVFVQEMFKAMRSTVPDGGLLDAGRSEEIFTGLLDEHVAGLTARRDGSGLADALYRQLTGENRT